MTLHHKTEAVFEHLKVCASEKHVVTYGDLGRAVDWWYRNLDSPLHELQDACQELNLPPITALVVLRRTGLPSTGYRAPDGRYQREAHAAVAKRVYGHPWSTVSIDALRAAMMEFRRKRNDNTDMNGDDIVPADLPTDDEIRAHAADLAQMYKVAYASASAGVAGAIGAPDLSRTAHEIALMTVRRFHELETAASTRFEEMSG